MAASTGSCPTFRRSILALSFTIALLSVAPSAASAQPVRTYCAIGDYPRFVYGFAVLRARLGGPVMGEPLTCEFPDPRGTGDVLQLTTRGLAFWRKSTNTPTFTNGEVHWALTPQSPLSVVFWYGPSIDPPPDAQLPQGAPENRCIYVGQPDC